MQFYTFGGADEIEINLFNSKEIEGKEYTKILQARQAGSPSEHMSALHDIIFLFTILPIYFLSFFTLMMKIFSNTHFERDEKKKVLVSMIGCMISTSITTLALLSIQINYFYVIVALRNIWLCIWAFLV
jgi:hypothetical protein